MSFRSENSTLILFFSIYTICIRLSAPSEKGLPEKLQFLEFLLIQRIDNHDFTLQFFFFFFIIGIIGNKENDSCQATVTLLYDKNHQCV